MTYGKFAAAAAAVFAAVVLAGCAGSGTVIKDDGTTDEPKWHKPYDDVIFNKHLGTFPNLQGLKEIRSGMTKDQLY